MQQIYVIANQADYTVLPIDELNQPIDALIHAILSVRYNGAEIEMRTEEQMDAGSDTWRSDAPGDSMYWIPTSQNTFTLYPTPASAIYAGLKVRAILKPSRTATSILTALYDNYGEQIASGAKARMCAIPSTPWTDAALSQYHRGLFEVGIAKAEVAAARAYGRGLLETKMSVLR